MPGSLKRVMQKLCLCGPRRDDPSDQPPPRTPRQRPSPRASRAPGPNPSTVTRPSTAIPRPPTPLPQTRPTTPAPETAPASPDASEKDPDELDFARAQAPPPPTDTPFFAYVPDLAPTIRIVPQGSPKRPSPLVIDAHSIADSASMNSETRPTTGASSIAATPTSTSSESTLNHTPELPMVKPLAVRKPPTGPNLVPPRPKTASRAHSDLSPSAFWNPTHTTPEGWTSLASLSRPQTRAC